MTLIRNIGALVGCGPAVPKRGRGMSAVDMLRDAWLIVDDESGLVKAFGTMDEPPVGSDGMDVVDAGGKWVFPSFCDSHTHIVYAGSREGEFADRISGLTYEEIARRGGGILNSVDRLRALSENELYERAMVRVHEIVRKGTGAVEIKSGYGLDLENELKMLRVIRRIKESSPLTVVSTFLGAHAVPREFIGRKEEYVEYICREMIPAVGAEGLADFVDLFCERGFFSPGDVDKVFDAAERYGIKKTLHANQLAVSGGVQSGVAHGAFSVDHLESVGDEEIALLSDSPTVATLLPGASFFLDMQYAPARRLIDSGACVALASDYNPGSSPSGDMRFVVSLGCIKMRMSVVEALNAATVNGAKAMDLDSVGSLGVGMRANFFMTDPLPSIEYFAYAYTSPIIKDVYLQGVKMC